MRLTPRRALATFLTLTTLGLGPASSFVSAAEDVDQISDEIDQKKSHIDQLNRQIDQYRDKIEQKHTEAVTLNGEMELLDNRVAKTELEIEAARESIDATNRELVLIEMQISEVERSLATQRELLKDVLRQVEQSDQHSTIELLFGNDSFSDLFDQLEYLEIVNDELRQTLETAKASKQSLLAFRGDQEAKKASLEELSSELEAKMEQLERELQAKETLIVQTKASEAEFKNLLAELKEEQQGINNQIAALQETLERRLYENGTIDDSISTLSWPFNATKGISATFHDRSYPFRHLFEHSGIDLPTNVGTTVGSAAPGYVAWAREGKGYGYYVMVIHANRLATIYAHLSKILVEQDQFVARGQAVGLSGGKPGMAGAGLSTGPHLHFEVREDGIPVNPLNYLDAD
ncbi:peptidoglycan DD-metalloendopeptidase family protein [Candidatus Uhrbacteria bacterium]|nr:peptidoglycan DD-metalloendopeptidase family protein [Candidatus Uhrbacteria bacterium]